VIDWRVHLASSPEAAWHAWTTDSGRERFWATTSRAVEGGFELSFRGGEALRVEVVEEKAAERLVFRYFGGSTVTLDLTPDSKGGCDLRLREEGAPDPVENHAGWVSVLLAFKAAVDFGIDLRSHDPGRSWGEGYVDVEGADVSPAKPG
jgi:uncharacterized protein YndB with AHSA1/START domain